jgi:hypothetical protein
VRRVRTLLARQELWPLLPIVVAALLLFLRLGSYGFWEPHEIQVADRARTALEDSRTTAPPVDDEPDDEEARPAQPQPGAASEPGMAVPAVKETKKPKRPPAADSKEPRLTATLVESGIERFGHDELGARFFLAMAGLLGVAAVALLGLRLAGGRAGMLAGLAFLSFPIVVLQARHLTSDIGALAGAALMALGLVGLVRPTPLGWLRPPWTFPVDALLIAAGGLLSYQGAASWNGLVPPLAGVGVGALVAGLADGRAGFARQRHLVIGGALCLVAAAVLLGQVLAGVFDLVAVADGQRGLLGWTTVATGEPVAGLGGTWRKEGDPSATVTNLFEQIAYGSFPWVAIAPLAVAALGLGGTSQRRFSAAVLGAWTLVAWALSTIFQHKVGAVTYPAYAALAVAVGLWLDALWSARAAAPDAAGPDAAAPDAARSPLAAALPVAAVFALFCAVVVGRDLYNFPDRLTSLNLDGQTLKWPEGAALHKAMPVIGIGFGLAMAAALLLVGRLARVGRGALVTAVVIGSLGAVFFSQVFSPRLAARLSSRGVFAAYHELRRDGDELGIVGNPGPGPRFYAGDDYVPLRGRTELIEFLRRPGRVFALVRANELCPLHKASSSDGFRFAVVDDSNDQFLLLSNQLGEGERDHNPLADAIVRTPPADLGAPLSFEFEDTIRLLGVRMPAEVERGDSFEVTLIFEVLKPITRNWKIFVHFDSGSSRFQGDHAPIRERCGTSFFQPGDVVVDRFTVKAGSMVDGTPKTTYQVFTGFFVGSNPNYTNMKVSKGEADDNNRVKIGTIRLR